MEYLIIGLSSALACYIVLVKALGYKTMLALEPLIDAVFSIALALAFWGTFSGMVTAVLGGLALSAMLYATRKITGYRRPGIKTLVRGFHRA